jgi:8-oxo-dGTP diphosphatase
LDCDRKHWVSVAAAIVDGERVLAIRRRDNNKWEPPGGILEPNETIIEGLRREVLEETGIGLSEPALSGVYKNMNRGIVALVYRSIHNGESPKQSDEVVESRWMTVEEVEENLDPAYAVRLLDALRNGAAATRTHDGIRLLDSADDPPHLAD